MTTQVLAGGNAREFPPTEAHVSDLLLVIFCQFFPVARGLHQKLGVAGLKRDKNKMIINKKQFDADKTSLSPFPSILTAWKIFFFSSLNGSQSSQSVLEGKTSD